VRTCGSIDNIQNLTISCPACDYALLIIIILIAPFLCGSLFWFRLHIIVSTLQIISYYALAVISTKMKVVVTSAAQREV
jgi:hypothetical protein